MLKHKEISDLLKKHDCTGFIISHPSNITWVTGLVSSNALLYIDSSDLTIITDSRYATAAKKLSGVKAVIADQESLVVALKKNVKLGSRIGYQPEYVNSLQLKDLQKVLNKSKLVAISGIFKEQIATKHPEEIALIKKAQQITEAVLPEILALLKPGVTEKEIAGEIIYRQLKYGADGISPEFWPIVAFGANSGLPHAKPSDTKLKKGDVVLLDYGCTVGGYCSDMTRTFTYDSASEKFREVYVVVLNAQKAGLNAAKSGITGKALDKVVRDVIIEAGYGEQFGHGTGHGVGLEIHEWPTINSHSDHILPEGAVITIEPGIYLSGEFGVRIEDMVVLEKNSMRNLTNAPKDLTVI